MNNCSQHKKDLYGQTDMQQVAEEIGNLHYEALAELIWHLSVKLQRDSAQDLIAGRKNISLQLGKAGNRIKGAWVNIRQAWKISEPFMNDNK